MTEDARTSGWTRREVVGAGLACGATLLAGRALADDRLYGPFRMGIQSYSLRGFDFETALQMTQKLGLHYWEAFQAHVPRFKAQPGWRKPTFGVTFRRFSSNHARTDPLVRPPRCYQPITTVAPMSPLSEKNFKNLSGRRL